MELSSKLNKYCEMWKPDIMVSANDNISDTHRFNYLNLSLVSTWVEVRQILNRQTVCLFVSPPSRSELQPSSGQIFTDLSSNLINIAKRGQQKLWIARMITHQIRIVLFPHRMVPWNQMRKLKIYNVIICNYKRVITNQITLTLTCNSRTCGVSEARDPKFT